MCEAARNAFPVRRSERPARSASSARWKRSWAKFSTVIAGSSISPSAPFSFSHWSMRERTNPMSAFGTLARSFIALLEREEAAVVRDDRVLRLHLGGAVERYGLTDLREVGQSMAEARAAMNSHEPSQGARRAQKRGERPQFLRVRTSQTEREMVDGRRESWRSVWSRRCGQAPSPAARQPARGGAGPRCRPGAGAPARSRRAQFLPPPVRRRGGDRLGPGDLVQRRGDDAAAVAQAAKQGGDGELVVRMGVRAGGCSGMSYVMDVAGPEAVNEGDTAVECDAGRHRLRDRPQVADVPVRAAPRLLGRTDRRRLLLPELRTPSRRAAAARRSACERRCCCGVPGVCAI